MSTTYTNNPETDAKINALIAQCETLTPYQHLCLTGKEKGSNMGQWAFMKVFRDHNFTIEVTPEMIGGEAWYHRDNLLRNAWAKMTAQQQQDLTDTLTTFASKEG